MARNRMAKSGEISGDLVDRYTAMHFAVGSAAGLANLPWWGIVGVAVGWEAVENHLKDAWPSIFPNPTHDTLSNSLFDALAFISGAYAGFAMRDYLEK